MYVLLNLNEIGELINHRWLNGQPSVITLDTYQVCPHKNLIYNTIDRPILPLVKQFDDLVRHSRAWVRHRHIELAPAGDLMENTTGLVSIHWKTPTTWCFPWNRWPCRSRSEWDRHTRQADAVGTTLFFGLFTGSQVDSDTQKAKRALKTWSYTRKGLVNVGFRFLLNLLFWWEDQIQIRTCEPT